MSEEIWKPVNGYEGLYEVSNKGRVRSVERIIKKRDGSMQRVKGRVIKQNLSGPEKGKYLAVGLHKDGVQVTKRVHRLVADAFIPNDDPSLEVDHVDADRLNNCVENLRWVTHLENMRYMVAAGNYRGSYREMLKPEVRAKLLPKLRKRVIRDDGVVFSSITEAAKAMGRTRNAVGGVVGHPTRKCNGHSFRLVD